MPDSADEKDSIDCKELLKIWKLIKSGQYPSRRVFLEFKEIKTFAPSVFPFKEEQIEDCLTKLKDDHDLEVQTHPDGKIIYRPRQTGRKITEIKIQLEEDAYSIVKDSENIPRTIGDWVNLLIKHGFFKKKKAYELVNEWIESEFLITWKERGIHSLYVPKYVEGQHSKAALPRHLEESTNFIIFPKNTYVWFDIRNFPPLYYLGIDYLSRFESATKKIHDGLCELDKIRVDIANQYAKPIVEEYQKEIMERSDLFENLNEHETSDNNKFWGEYVFQPLIVSSWNLSNIIPKWFEISDKWETFNFQSYFISRMENASNWGRGVLEINGYSENEVNDILKEYRLSTKNEREDFAFELFKNYWIKHCTIVLKNRNERYNAIKKIIDITTDDLDHGKEIMKKLNDINFPIPINERNEEDEEILSGINMLTEWADKEIILHHLNTSLHKVAFLKKRWESRLNNLKTNRKRDIITEFRKFPAPSIKELEEIYPESLNWEKKFSKGIQKAIQNRGGINK